MKQFTDLEKLKDFIVGISENRVPYIIAVDGFGGAGKSVLCEQFSGLLGDCGTIAIDDFIVAPHEPNVFDHDWQAMEDLVLKRIRRDSTVTKKIYDWHALQAISPEMTDVRKFMLFDGIGFLKPKYAKYFDLRVWVDCPIELSLERGKKRDKEEQGSDHDELWDTVWGPAELQYFKEYRPDLSADVHYRTY